MHNDGYNFPIRSHCILLEPIVYSLTFKIIFMHRFSLSSNIVLIAKTPSILLLNFTFNFTFRFLVRTDTVACVENCEEICGTKDGCSNLAYPLLVMNILPDGKSN